MNNIIAVGGSLIRRNMRQYGMIIALVVIAILFESLTNVLFHPMNIANLVTQNGHILILAVGMMPVIITGRVDLSVGSLLAFSSAMSGIFIITMGWPIWVAIPAVLAIGALSGAWNGYWIAYKNVPFFVVTLGGMLIFRGLTMYVLEGMTLSPFPPAFHTLAAGFVPDIFGGSNNITAYVLCAILSLVFVALELRNRRIARKYEEELLPLPFFIIRLAVVVGVINLFGYWFGAFRGVPNMLILLVFLVAVYNFVANNTVFGRHVYAVGGNAKAAELSGIKAKRVVFWVYVNMGMLAALAGIMFASRLNAATPRAEAGFELQAIAAAFIGGASPGGGIGKISGAIIGAMLMGVLNNGLSHRGIGADVQLAITGLVLLAAVIFDVFTRAKVAK